MTGNVAETWLDLQLEMDRQRVSNSHCGYRELQPNAYPAAAAVPVCAGLLSLKL